VREVLFRTSDWKGFEAFQFFLSIFQKILFFQTALHVLSHVPLNIREPPLLYKKGPRGKVSGYEKNKHTTFGTNKTISSNTRLQDKEEHRWEIGSSRRGVYED
jgi:hypothetical protein